MDLDVTDQLLIQPLRWKGAYIWCMWRNSWSTTLQAGKLRVRSLMVSLDVFIHNIWLICNRLKTASTTCLLYFKKCYSTLKHGLFPLTHYFISTIHFSTNVIQRKLSNSPYHSSVVVLWELGQGMHVLLEHCHSQGRNSAVPKVDGWLWLKAGQECRDVLDCHQLNRGVWYLGNSSVWISRLCSL